MTVVSTAEDAVKMNLRYLQGLGLSRAAGGFLAGAEEDLPEIASLIKTLLQKLGGPPAA